MSSLKMCKYASTCKHRTMERESMNDITSESPIKSGWRGNLNGAVTHTDSSEIRVSEITLKLDYATAWALCNLLTGSALDAAKGTINDQQRKPLETIGAAIGRLIDHPAANNGGRACVK